MFFQVETDGETQIGTEEEEEEELLGADENRDEDVEVDTISLEARYENMLEGKLLYTVEFFMRRLKILRTCKTYMLSSFL